MIRESSEKKYNENLEGESSERKQWKNVESCLDPRFLFYQ